jgi:hypothetical protein
LIKDRAALLSFYDFPAEHWKHLRTTNVIESSFASLRRDSVQTDEGAGLHPPGHRLSLFEPSNEANNERGECGENVGEQLLLPQPPPCRQLFLFVPDRMGLALFDLPDAQTFELTAPGAPLSPSCHLARHRIC